MYENIYGLSCVENQILYHLKLLDMDISMLYSDSLIAFDDLYNSFVINEESPDYFNKIPKIQNTLQSLGVLQYSYYKKDDISEVLLNLKNVNDFLLFRVKSDFAKNTLYARGFRPDHYVCAKRLDKNIEIINDIPYKKILISQEELYSIYDGSYIVFTIIRYLNEYDREILSKNIINIPQNANYISENCVPIKQTNDLNLRIRNLLRILKILRYRVYEYYRNYIDVGFIKEMCILINKYFATCEYFNLRNVVDNKKYIELLNKVIEADNKIISGLKERSQMLRDHNKNK